MTAENLKRKKPTLNIGKSNIMKKVRIDENSTIIREEIVVREE